LFVLVLNEKIPKRDFCKKKDDDDDDESGKETQDLS
jgi:hypothetical protein